MLYYTSTYIEKSIFFTLEDIFKHIKPERVALVYDTNIVVYFRDLFLNPKQFINTVGNEPIVLALKYLIEQVHRYDLQVIASFGVDESSRRKCDFSINQNKLKQTHEAMLKMLSFDLEGLDQFIKTTNKCKPFIDDSTSPQSMLSLLKQKVFYQQWLIPMYLYCIKTIVLYSQWESNKINRTEAMLQLLKYMNTELQLNSSIMHVEPNLKVANLPS